VPVVLLKNKSSRLGGAANVALNLKALGATPYLCSVVGKDAAGKELMELLPEQQLSTKGILTSAERVTTVKSRVIAGAQQMLRLDQEDTHELTKKEERTLLSQIVNLLESKTIHAILFQDYNKGVLSPTLIREVILEAVKRDIPTAVDPKFNNFWAYKRVSLFKPNLKEIRAQLPFSVQSERPSLNEATTYIRGKLDNQYTLITLSEKGIFFDDGGGQQAIMPTLPRSIADVCGAGDTVFAVAGLGLSLGMDMEGIAQLANLAGGQVCEHLGVVPVNRSQLQQEYQTLLKSGTLS
jgi:rfaE bifunctional protein kinase chain/domain